MVRLEKMNDDGMMVSAIAKRVVHCEAVSASPSRGGGSGASNKV